MNDSREEVDGRDVFVHGSSNLADFRTPLVTSSCSVAAGAGDIGHGDFGDRNTRDQRGAHGVTGAAVGGRGTT